MTQAQTRIAFPSEDGERISRHFGKAAYFVIASLQTDGNYRLERRRRDHWKGQHESGLIQLAEPADNSETGADTPEVTRIISNGLLAGSEDCQVLIAGGMGQAAYQRAVQQGLQVILTGEKEIAKAVDLYRQDKLSSDMRRVHQH